jgi:hypothetical protein
MSAADRFAEETSNAATAMNAARSILIIAAPDSTAGADVQDPSYLAHTLTNLRHATAEVEFILWGLHRRAGYAAQHDTCPGQLRDLLTTLALTLRTSSGHAHTAWRVMCQVENHGDAIKNATRGTRPTVTATGDRLAEATTNTTNALAAAHTILAGLSQSYYGGQAVLNADDLEHALSMLRQITDTLTAILRVLGRHARHLADNPAHPDTVREPAAALAADLSAASAAARGLIPGLRRLEQQATDIQKAARGTTLAL